MGAGGRRAGARDIRRQGLRGARRQGRVREAGRASSGPPAASSIRSTRMCCRSKIPNAIALPGGKIYLFDGLLQKAASPDEIAGIIAHELGHAHHRHNMRTLIYNGGTSFLIGLLLGDITGGSAVIFATRSAAAGLAFARGGAGGRRLRHHDDAQARPLAGADGRAAVPHHRRGGQAARRLQHPQQPSADGRPPGRGQEERPARTPGRRCFRRPSGARSRRSARRSDGSLRSFRASGIQCR